MLTNEVNKAMEAQQRVSLQLGERTSLNESSGDLSSGVDRRESSSKDDPYPARKPVGEGNQEPSKGAEGGSTLTGKGNDKIHGHEDDAQLRQKLKEKDTEIGQLMDTMGYLTTALNAYKNTISELGQIKKENEELHQAKLDLELENRLLRSNSEGFNLSEVEGHSSLALEQKMCVLEAVGSSGRSEQGSIIAIPEDEAARSLSSFEFMPDPYHLEVTENFENKAYHKNGATTSILQQQIQEHEEAFRKEHNDRIMLNQKCKQLKRDVKVLTQEKNLALQRAERAEAEERKAKEEVSKLLDELDQMRRTQSSRAPPSSPIAIYTKSGLEDLQSLRDPLQCVWPLNNYRLLMPSNYSRSQNNSPSRTAGSPQSHSKTFPTHSENKSGALSEGEEAIGPGEDIKYLQWDHAVTKIKKEGEDSLKSSMDFHNMEGIKKTTRQLNDVDRWSCQTCTYRNRASRSSCDYCGTVDAVQRRRLNHCI